MEKKVLQQEELNKIQELRDGFSNLTNIVGNIEMQILSLELEKDQIKEDLKNLKLKEINLAENLKNAYGDGNISLETGEFTPFEKEQTQPTT